MAKQSVLFSILFSLALVAAAHGGFPRKEKVIRLQLFAEDILSGPTPSVVQVARANSSLTSPTFFGLVNVFDDPVRLTADTSSAIVGRAQGLFALASLEEPAVHASFDVVFSAGKYNGSSFSVVGNNPFTRKDRELPIVGGSGVFRLARGWIGQTTVYARQDGAVYQYNVTLVL